MLLGPWVWVWKWRDFFHAVTRQMAILFELKNLAI